MKLTPKAFEKLSRTLAEACNGGIWETHFTQDHKKVCRERGLRVAELNEVPRNDR